MHIKEQPLHLPPFLPECNLHLHKQGEPEVDKLRI